MAKRTNNDILGGILDMLDQIIQENRERRKEFNELKEKISDAIDEGVKQEKTSSSASADKQEVKLEVDGNDGMIQLLAGVLTVDKMEKLGDLTEQVNKLTDAMKIIDKINNKKLSDSLQSMANLFTSLSKLNFGEIDPDNVQSMTKMVTDMCGAFDGKNFNVKNVEGVANLLQVFNTLDPKNFSKVSSAFDDLDPQSAYNLCAFLEPIYDLSSRYGKKANVGQMKTLFEGLGILLSSMSMAKLLVLKVMPRAMNESSGKALAGFFKPILELTTQYKPKEMQYLTTFMGQLTKSFGMMLLFLVGLGTAFKLLGWKPILEAVGGLAAVTLILTGATLLISKASKGLTQGISALKDLAIGVGIMILCLASVMVIQKVASPESIMKSFGFVMTMVLSLVGVVMLIGLIDMGTAALGKMFNIGGALLGQKGAKGQKGVFATGAESLRNLGVAVLMMVGTIALVLLIQKLAQPQEIWGAFGIVMAITMSLVGVVFLLSMIKKSKIEAATGALVGIGAAVAILTLTIGVMCLIVNKFGAKTILLSLGVVLGVTLGMSMMLKSLGSMKKGQMLFGIGVLMTLVACMSLITLIIDKQIVPLAESKKMASIALGTLVVLGTLEALILMMRQLTNKMKPSQLAMGALALVVLMASCVAISYIAMNYFIPLGEKAAKVALGSAIVLATIETMILMYSQLNKIAKRGKVEMFTTMLAMVVLVGVVYAVSYISNEYFIPLGENAGKVALGSALVLATVEVTYQIFKQISKIKKSKALQGAIVMGIIAGTLFIVSKIMNNYFVPLGKHSRETAIGSALVLATIGVMALIVAAAGRIPKSQAIVGSAVMAVVVGLLWLVSKAMNPYVDLCSNINKNKAALGIGSGLIALVLAGMTALIIGVGALVMNPITAALLAAGAAAMLVLSGVIAAMSGSILLFVHLVQKTSEGLKPASLQQFNKVIVGNGQEDKNSLAGSIQNVVSGLCEVGAWAAIKARFISSMLRPVFETISIFIDIVAKLCNMRMVDEYDENGRPKSWKAIPPDTFQKAGIAISVAFGQFLNSLGQGLKSFDVRSAYVLRLISGSLKPVMEAVRNFTDSIISVISAQIPIEYNQEGKPIKFRTFQKDEFVQAASLISVSFSDFIETMIPTLQKLPARALMAINLMKDSIKPLMESVQTFANTIVNLMAGVEIETTLSNGNVKKERFKIDPDKFSESAKLIGTSFVSFIDNLYTTLKTSGLTDTFKVVTETNSSWGGLKKSEKSEQHSKIGDLMNGLNGIGTLMEAANTMVNMIATVAKNPAMKDMVGTGKLIATSMVSFVQALETQFNATRQKNVSVISGSMPNLQKIINAFIDMVKKMDGVKKLLANDMATPIIKVFTKLSDASTAKVFGNARTNIANQLSPTITSLAQILEFFDKGKYQGITISQANAQKSMSNMSKCIVENAKAIAEYNKVSRGKPNIAYLANLSIGMARSYKTVSNAYSNFTKNLYSINPQFQRGAMAYMNGTKMMTSSTDSLSDAMKKFDEVLLKDKDKRLEALKELKDHFGEIAQELEKVSNGIDKTRQYRQDADDYREEKHQASVFHEFAQTTTNGIKHAVQGVVAGTGHDVKSSASYSNTASSSTGVQANANDGQMDKRMQSLGTIIAQSVQQALDDWVNQRWEVTFRDVEGKTTNRCSGKISRS